MAKYLVDLDLDDNELKNVTIHKLAQAPSNPVKSQMYFNTTDNKLYVYDGTQWINALSQGDVSRNDVLTKDNTNAYTPTDNYNPATKKYVDDNVSGLSETYAQKSNVLEKNNAGAYTPSNDYNPATKKYVDDSVSSKGDMFKSVYDTNNNGIVDKATGDKNGNDITTEYYKASNPNGYTSNIGTITEIKINNSTVSTSGVANISSIPSEILTGTIPGEVKAATQAAGANNKFIATTEYVDRAISNLPTPMVYKGSLGTGGTITSLPAASASNNGWTYKVITAGTYAGQAAKVGDIFISNGLVWNLIPSGDEPSGTVTSIKLKGSGPIVVDDETPVTISGERTISHATSGVSAGTYGDSSAQTPTLGGSFKALGAKVDADGHITEINEHTVTLPSSVALGSQVTGTLPIENGGTGKTTAADAINYLINNGCSEGTSTPKDSDYYISQYTNGGTATTTYHRRPMSAMWTWISGKISSVLGLTANNYTGKSLNTDYGTCESAADTVAKVVSINTTGWTLKVGSIIGVKFTNTNSASKVTLNVNNTGAKSIYYAGSVYTGTDSNICGYTNRISFYMYDGTNWVWITASGNLNSNTVPAAYCNTGAAIAAKTATYTGYALSNNRYIYVTITSANTSASAITLNINGKGAKPIYINGAASSASNYSLPAGSYIVFYDGTNYQFRTDGYIPGYAKIHNGTGVPSSSLGADGDIYVKYRA